MIGCCDRVASNISTTHLNLSKEKVSRGKQSHHLSGNCSTKRKGELDKTHLSRREADFLEPRQDGGKTVCRIK
jgi:hypothetical protein